MFSSILWICSFIVPSVHFWIMWNRGNLNIGHGSESNGGHVERVCDEVHHVPPSIVDEYNNFHNFCLWKLWFKLTYRWCIPLARHPKVAWSQTIWDLREGVNAKKTFSFGHCPNDGGGGLPMPEFFGPLSISAFLVNKKSLFLQKCQCIELLTVF